MIKDISAYKGEFRFIENEYAVTAIDRQEAINSGKNFDDFEFKERRSVFGRRLRPGKNDA